MWKNIMWIPPLICSYVCGVCCLPWDFAVLKWHKVGFLMMQLDLSPIEF